MCGGVLEPVSDVVGWAVERAVAEGAVVEVLGGEAGVLLAERGGMGAWLRY